ncbi:hypothetical protein Nepgr_021955 [Nepenthes gracilis]|uniref:Uncharacterized protein n=1 Tax=Nepenthes gracilis TaxID=150966 RepID=A0AAD3XXK3_NEPGR|nr:hypothetical protein Nepgr_021955 [Nepenthes gracilis]
MLSITNGRPFTVSKGFQRCPGSSQRSLINLFRHEEGGSLIGPPNRISTVSVVAERERDERDKRRNDQSKLQPIYSHRRKLTPFLFGKLCEFCEFVLRHRVRLVADCDGKMLG